MDTLISVWDLPLVLEGAVVASQAPGHVRSELLMWILSLDADDLDDLDDEKPMQDLLDGATRILPKETDALRLLKVILAVSVLRQASQAESELSADQLDEVWRLLREGFMDVQGPSELEFKVSRGAPGYLSIPLCSLVTEGRIDELLRIHVWLPDAVRAKETVAIHAHQTFAQSWVIAGQMTNHKYKAESTYDESLATNAEFLTRWDNGKYAGSSYKTIQRSSTASNTKRLFIVTPEGSEQHMRNSSYAMPGGEHHWPTAGNSRFCATLFYFDSYHGTFVPDASVMGPVNQVENVQKKDPGPYTAAGLIEMVDAVRAWEDLKSTSNNTEDEDEVVTAYYNFITGREYLSSSEADSDNRKTAFEFFNAGDCPPIIAFCKESLPLHRQYLKTLLDAGEELNIDAVDEKGSKALDHAMRTNNEEAEAMILNASRWKSDKCKIDRLVYEARTREGYREIFDLHLRQYLDGDSENALVQMRQEYARVRDGDEAKSDMFEGLCYVRYADFIKSERLPRYSDGTLKTYVTDAGEDTADHIVYLAYRWLYKNPITGKTANDDVRHSQYHRMLRAIDKYLELHPEVDLDKLGIWLDSACVNRKNPNPGIAALPINLAQCNTLITIEDKHYWERAWCCVEAYMIQILRRSYSHHEWYRYAPENGNDDGPWSLSEAAVDIDIDMAATVMTWEEDRGKIDFLVRQADFMGKRESKDALASKPGWTDTTSHNLKLEPDTAEEVSQATSE